MRIACDKRISLVPQRRETCAQLYAAFTHFYLMNPVQLIVRLNRVRPSIVVLPTYRPLLKNWQTWTIYLYDYRPQVLTGVSHDHYNFCLQDRDYVIIFIKITLWRSSLGVVDSNLGVLVCYGSLREASEFRITNRERLPSSVNLIEESFPVET